MQSVLVPVAVVAVVAVFAGRKALVRRRFEKMKVSGGRMALVLNLVNRSR